MEDKYYLLVSDDVVKGMTYKNINLNDDTRKFIEITKEECYELRRMTDLMLVEDIEYSSSMFIKRLIRFKKHKVKMSSLINNIINKHNEIVAKYNI